jgi:hypothetical protein
MSEERRRLKALHYVEDYLEDLLYMLLSAKERPEVEVKIEEAKEAQKIRVVSVTPEGRKTEIISEAPHPSLKELPLLTPINVMRPLELTQPILPLENEVSAEVRLQSLYKIGYLLQMPVKVFDYEVKRILPLHLPLVSPIFYSWLREEIKPVGFLEQPEVNAFTLKNLLRLVEILPKLPRTAERIEANVKVPALTSSIFPIQNEVKTTLTDTAESLRAKAQAQHVKGRGLLELIFPEEMEKFRRFRGVSGGYVGEPIIIVLPESEHHLWYLFWVICREFYREVKGEYPEPVVLLDKGCELWLRVSGMFSEKIIILREQSVKDDESKKWFKRRLQEAFSQGLGFLIIMTKNVDNTVTFIKESCKPYAPMIIDVRTLPELSHLMEVLIKVLSAGFGIPYSELCRVDDLRAGDKVAMIVEGKLQEFPQMDIIVTRVDRAYRNFVNELLSSNYLAHVRRDVSERESEDHVAMKILAIKYINERFNIKPEKIACTFDVGSEVIADVYVEEKALAVECETMFGTAPAPLLKIFESVRKYIERAISKPINEIWVIIRNWSAILHLGDLLWIENILREELKKRSKEINVKFFIPDVYGKSLKPIDDIVNIIFSGG